MDEDNDLLSKHTFCAIYLFSTGKPMPLCPFCERNVNQITRAIKWAVIQIILSLLFPAQLNSKPYKHFNVNETTAFAIIDRRPKVPIFKKEFQNISLLREIGKRNEC